jgi:negative regulator of sigma-B (phosphoserine phosphatase)
MMAITIATRPRRGETANGDATVVRHEADCTLFAVIDALGHGAAASATAQVAVSAMERAELDGGVIGLMRTLDYSLKGTRGAQALVGWVRGEWIECCAVGNVDLRTVGVRLPVMLAPGILGNGVKRLQSFGGMLPRSSRLIVFSDGISGRFAANETRDLALSDAAHAILERHGRDSDDATVMVLEAR